MLARRRQDAVRSRPFRLPPDWSERCDSFKASAHHGPCSGFGRFGPFSAVKKPASALSSRVDTHGKGKPMSPEYGTLTRLPRVRNRSPLTLYFRAPENGFWRQRQGRHRRVQGGDISVSPDRAFSLPAGNPPEMTAILRRSGCASNSGRMEVGLEPTKA